MVTRMMLVLALLAGAAPAMAAEASGRLYSVARMTSAIDGAALVGTRRAGTLCLPNGPVRWSEVLDVNGMDQRELVEDALEDAGVRLTPLGLEPGTTARLRGTIRSAHFSVCAHHWLGGGSKSVSGETALTVEWRLEAPAGGPVATHVSAVTRTVDPEHAAPLGALYRALLDAAAQDAAGWLKTN